MKEFFIGKKDRIYYWKNDFSSKRKTLVFVHGLSGSSSAWDFYVKCFNKRYNLLLIDLRGHGKSFRPKKYLEYGISFFAEDLYQVVKHERLSNFFLISHSFANLIVLDFANNYLKLVRGLILLSPDFNPSRRFSSKAVHFLLRMIRPLLELFPDKKSGSHINYQKYPNGGDWNIPRMIADIGNTGLKSYLLCSLHAARFNAERVLKKINVPTLLVHGKKDSIFPVECSVEMSKKIKNSELKIMPGADHILVLNHPKKISKLISNFVDRN